MACVATDVSRTAFDSAFYQVTCWLSLSKQRAGFCSAQAFWFSFPHAGSFTTSLASGRTEAIGALRRSKRREALESALLARGMRRSVRRKNIAQHAARPLPTPCVHRPFTPSHPLRAQNVRALRCVDKNFPCQGLGVAFHLTDLVARGEALRLVTAAGSLIRLRG